MQPLNLPPVPFKIQKQNGKTLILDVIRKKYVFLTPEEWVRQHLVHYLINDLGYAKGLIRIESGVKYNEMMKRSDVVVYNTNGDADLLVECKAPNVRITQAALDQVSVYNRTIKAKQIAVTNGLQQIAFEINFETNQFTRLEGIKEYKKSPD